MFPEYRELINELKSANPRFLSLFDKHNQLDDEILRKGGPQGTGYNEKVVQMKKEKLRLKDDTTHLLAATSLFSSVGLFRCIPSLAALPCVKFHRRVDCAYQTSCGNAGWRILVR